MSFIAATVVKLTCPDTRTGNLDESVMLFPLPHATAVGDSGVGSGGGGPAMVGDRSLFYVGLLPGLRK